MRVHLFAKTQKKRQYTTTPLARFVRDDRFYFSYIYTVSKIEKISHIDQILIGHYQRSPKSLATHTANRRRGKGKAIENSPHTGTQDMATSHEPLPQTLLHHAAVSPAPKADDAPPPLVGKWRCRLEMGDVAVFPVVGISVRKGDGYRRLVHLGSESACNLRSHWRQQTASPLHPQRPPYRPATAKKRNEAVCVTIALLVSLVLWAFAIISSNLNPACTAFLLSTLVALLGSAG